MTLQTLHSIMSICNDLLSKDWQILGFSASMYDLLAFDLVASLVIWGNLHLFNKE